MMKFVTDLSKGVLGTPDSPVLWNQILSNVPDSLLLKPDFKCLVVACGHCTEAVLLVKRMQSLGIPDSRIQDAIWVLDKYSVFTNQARKYGFKNIITADFLLWDPKGMRFDLVMGNPPYQIPISRTGSKHIYQEFVKKTCELGTHILFIIPDNWMVQSNRLGTSVRFILERAGLKSVTINPFDQFGSAIVETCWIYCEKGYSGEVSLTKDGETYFRNRNKPFIPTDDIGVKIIDKVKESVRENWKVIHPNPNKPAFFVGPAYRSFNVFTSPINPIHVFSNEKCNGRVALIECGSREDAEKILPFYKTYFESKLMRYVLLITRTSYALDSPQLSYIPKIPMNRTWTDQELYTHFNLTDEEIEYIEEQVK